MDILEYSSGQYGKLFPENKKKACRFKNFQEYPMCSQNLEYSWNFFDQHKFLDFLVKAC